MGRDVVEYFLSSQDRGYCMHFASAATLVLRYVGIPARYCEGYVVDFGQIMDEGELVEGKKYEDYFSGYNKLGETALVTVDASDADAHAWVEVYIDRKWYIFDPTPPLTEMSFARPSWLAVKLEGVKGRFSYVMHLLKDGEWRRIVDGWQAASERLVSSPVLYVVLAILLLFFALLRLRSSRRQHKLQAVSKNAAQWIALLADAEKRLARVGFNRAPGETVSVFAKRIEQALNAMHANAQATKKASPKDSRFDQECSFALKQLREYENNRWRKN